MDNFLILDVSSAPLPDAETYLEGTVRAPAHYKDPQKIAEYIAEKTAERIQMAATDVDLACITGIAVWHVRPGVVQDSPIIETANRRSEEHLLGYVAEASSGARIITFGGFNFDLPLLMRRARYLNVDFPAVNLDRYKSPHLDLCELLSDRNPQRRRSLQFYAKRLGWTDITKPLDGAAEAAVLTTRNWDGLRASLLHDVTATKRLAAWMGILRESPAVKRVAS